MRVTGILTNKQKHHWAIWAMAQIGVLSQQEHQNKNLFLPTVRRIPPHCIALLHEGHYGTLSLSFQSFLQNRIIRTDYIMSDII